MIEDVDILWNFDGIITSLVVYDVYVTTSEVNTIKAGAIPVGCEAETNSPDRPNRVCANCGDGVTDTYLGEQCD